MNLPRLKLPAGQNWSCHGCSQCCRGGLLISVTPAEKQRIEQQGWTAADGMETPALTVPHGSGFRLGHQSDGACVFLDPTGRCRIHEKFGAEAKPLACRLYPLVIHPAGKHLVAGLRFSCPSAAANLGQPLSEQAAYLQKLAGEFVPAGFQDIPPPAVSRGPVGEWPDLLCFTKWLDATLADPVAPLFLKLVRALRWLGAVEKGRLEHITGADLDEVLGALVKDAAGKLPTLAACPAPPSRFGRLFLRLHVLEHARTNSVADLQSGSRYRWRMLWSGLRFAGGFGSTPALRSGLGSVRFADLDRPFDPLPADGEAALQRFFRVKVQSLHFCGRAFHGRSLIEGFRSLALLYPTILWLARWRGMSQRRTGPTAADLTEAVSMADHHHGHSLDLPGRVRLLTQRNDIARLCAWRTG